MEELNENICLHGAIQLGSAICTVAIFVSVITLFLPSVK